MNECECKLKQKNRSVCVIVSNVIFDPCLMRDWSREGNCQRERPNQLLPVAVHPIATRSSRKVAAKSLNLAESNGDFCKIAHASET